MPRQDNHPDRGPCCGAAAHPASKHASAAVPSFFTMSPVLLQELFKRNLRGKSMKFSMFCSKND
jgi:hypothetical protein